MINNFSTRLNIAMKLKGMRPIDLINETKRVMKLLKKDYDGEGIDKTLLSKYMNGITKAKNDNIFILATALEVSPAWLMGLDVPMKEEQTVPIENFDENTQSFITKNGVKILLPADSEITADDILDAQEFLNDIRKGKYDK